MSPLRNIILGLLIICVSSSSAFARVVWRRSVEPWTPFRSKTERPEKTPPQIQDGKVYAVSSRGRYLVLDAQSGRRLLYKKLKYRASSGLLVAEGRAYFGAASGEFVCLDAATGEALWTDNLKVMDISRAVIAGDLVIFQTGLDAVTALNKTTGQWVWTYQHHRLTDMAVMGMSAPVADQQFIYVGTTDGFLLALTAADGGLAWKKQIFSKGNFRDIDADLSTDGDALFVSNFYGETAALSRKSGEKLWDFQAGGLAQPILEGDKLYLATRDGKTLALAKDTGLQLWETKLEDPKKITPTQRLLTPVRYKQWLIVPNLQGQLFLLDPSTGNLAKTKRLFHLISGPIKAGDDGLYLFSNKGIIYKISYK